MFPIATGSLTIINGKPNKNHVRESGESRFNGTWNGGSGME